MPYTIDPARWARIADMPLPTGVGDLQDGLCAVARIVYASTGEVSDMADAKCIAPTIREYMIALNDTLPSDLGERLGTRAIAERVLAADTSEAAERKRMFLCADTAVRVFTVSALRKAGLEDQAATLSSLKPIVDEETARAAFDAARAAARAAYAAAYAAYAAACDADYAADAARSARGAVAPRCHLRCLHSLLCMGRSVRSSRSDAERDGMTDKSRDALRELIEIWRGRAFMKRAPAETAFQECAKDLEAVLDSEQPVSLTDEVLEFIGELLVDAYMKPCMNRSWANAWAKYDVARIRDEDYMPNESRKMLGTGGVGEPT